MSVLLAPSLFLCLFLSRSHCLSHLNISLCQNKLAGPQIPLWLLKSELICRRMWGLRQRDKSGIEKAAKREKLLGVCEKFFVFLCDKTPKRCSGATKARSHHSIHHIAAKLQRSVGGVTQLQITADTKKPTDFPRYAGKESVVTLTFFSSSHTFFESH